MNLFDHADISSAGKSEQVFAKILRDSPGLRDRIIVQLNSLAHRRRPWAPASPATAGKFTAVGYFFARKIN